ncbi:hypothetical protein [Pseudonocardia asaccharolytica]|nr:hypothetical protein [Pseudonocardia asaccharolytica]
MRADPADQRSELAELRGLLDALGAGQQRIVDAAADRRPYGHADRAAG